MLAELANEQTHTVSEWIERGPGPRPVDARTLVQVRMRFELAIGYDETQIPKRAGAYDDAHWQHQGDELLDIVEFRVVRA